MKSASIFRFLLVCALFLNLSLQAEIKGKVDLGATLISIDILESGKTIDTISMGGVKGDATILLWQGVCIKPGFIYGQGKHRGQLAVGTIGIGHYTPITKCFVVVPTVGYVFSYLRTQVDFEEFGLFNLKERFRSAGPFIGLEFSYSFTDKLSLIGLVQYSWSRTHTKISPIISDTSHSNGPNYSLGLEYSLNKNWSLNMGVGYNTSLSREKHGLRGKGAKLGVAYYF